LRRYSPSTAAFPSGPPLGGRFTRTQLHPHTVPCALQRRERLSHWGDFHIHLEQHQNTYSRCVTDPDYSRGPCSRSCHTEQQVALCVGPFDRGGAETRRQPAELFDQPLLARKKMRYGAPGRQS